MRIHKYPIKNLGANLIECHRGRWLSAGLDGNGDLVAWREEDSDATHAETVYMVFTGYEPPLGNYRHLGTVTRGILVCHIYVC